MDSLAQLIGGFASGSQADSPLQQDIASQLSDTAFSPARLAQEADDKQRAEKERMQAMLEKALSVLNFYDLVPDNLAEWKAKEDAKAYDAWRKRKHELEAWLAEKSTAERAHIRHVLATQY